MQNSEKRQKNAIHRIIRLIKVFASIPLSRATSATVDILHTNKTECV